MSQDKPAMTGHPAAGCRAAGAAAGMLLCLALLAPAGAPLAQQAPQQPPAAAPAAAPAASPPAGSSEPVPTAAGAAAPAPSPLLVASWGGVYSRSQEEAIFRPFTKTTGIPISHKVYAGGLDDIRGQVASRQMIWDVVDVEPADLEEGCNAGLFLKLSGVLAAAPDGTPTEADFLPGTLHPCGVGSLAWSVAIAYSAGSGELRADDEKPASLEDFFDLERFPGGRGLRRTPMVNLEWALLADGVPGAEVYDLLRTEAGVARAFAKLDTIRDEIVWWNDASEPARLLGGGQVAMTSTYNAPMFNDIVIRQQPFALLWDHQVWDVDLWAIPTASPNHEAAMEFVRFATAPETLARQTRWIAYGPVRRSAIALVGDHVHAEVDMARYLPTTKENFQTALRNDARFWSERGPALVERFNAWLTR